MEFWKKHVLENHMVIAMTVLLLAVLLFQLKGILISLFFAYILAAALSPMVDFLVSKKAYRGVSVMTVYLALFLVVTLLIFPLVPFVSGQFSSLIKHFPEYVNRLSTVFGVSSEIDFVALAQSEANLIGKNAVSLTGKVFGGVFSFATVVVVSIYLLLDKVRIKEKVLSSLSDHNHARASNFLIDLDSRLGAWVRGQIFLSFVIGTVSFLGLTILGVPFALPLGLIAGILEAVPMIGPILSAVPAVVVALTISPVTAVLVIGLYILVQLLENNILVPKIMQKVVGLNPLAVIIGIMVGGNLLGVVGAILSLPVILVISTVVGHLRK